MHIAILMTNTDESAFAACHPRDGEKFQSLLWDVRPHWTFEVFAVKDGVFPSSLETFDGAIITGSPASVTAPLPWIAPLTTLIQQMVAEKLPIYGACFGHQIIAQALGGTVGPNPDGWVLGTVESELLPSASTLSLYAAHKEQVTALPPMAQVTARAKTCDIAGFAIGDHVETTQYHPEMTNQFIAALITEMAQETEAEVIASARASLVRTADRTGIAEKMAVFFESAQPHKT